MTNLPQPGERVEFDDHSGNGQTGTVIGVDCNPSVPGGYWFLIDRDNGNKDGRGPNGEWLISGDAWDDPKPWYAIRRTDKQRDMESRSTSDNIPGLSRESIDTDAYRDFMRGLA